MQKVLRSQEDVEKLRRFRKGLPWGAQKTISERLGVTQEWVSRVLNGHENSDLVMDVAIELWEKEKIRREHRTTIMGQV